MKKTYINPNMVAVPITHTQPIANSITGISGDTDDLELDLEVTPDEADVKGFGKINVWDVEW